MVPTINHWIGQEQAIRRFKVALEAAHTDATRLPHLLFVGPPGTGKTLLAQLAAKEMGVPIHERIAQVMNFPGALNGLLLQSRDKNIVFLDEIHSLENPAQTILYRAMEGQQISLRTNGDNTLNMHSMISQLLGVLLTNTGYSALYDNGSKLLFPSIITMLLPLQK